MKQSISNFKSNFIGGARPNLFQVRINYPTDTTNSVSPINGIGGNAVTDTLMVKGASLPGGVLGTIEVPFRGRKLKIAGDRTYEPWTITVINDVDMNVRNKLESWMNLISRNSSNTKDYASLAYMIDVYVDQLDYEQNIVKSYTLHDAYPTNISAIELNYETNDTVEEFTVEFNYQYWTSKESNVIDDTNI
jgi:hypothetical protein